MTNQEAAGLADILQACCMDAMLDIAVSRCNRLTTTHRFSLVRMDDGALVVTVIPRHNNPVEQMLHEETPGEPR